MTSHSSSLDLDFSEAVAGLDFLMSYFYYDAGRAEEFLAFNYGFCRSF
jgi:hypothetical protein